MGISIGPETTEREFRASAPMASILFDHAARRTYSLGIKKLGGLRFNVTLTFCSARLEQIELVLDDPPLGESWANHSVDDEKIRRKNHRTIVKSWAIAKESPWGSLEVSWDPQNVRSSLLLQYRSSR